MPYQKFYLIELLILKTIQIYTTMLRFSIHFYKKNLIFYTMGYYAGVNGILFNFFLV